MRRLLLADMNELRGLNEGELGARIMEAKEELLRLRVQHATLQLPDTSRLRQLRREVARMLTVQRERELATVEYGKRE
ncbi:MAG TPA: 50S ribosomal protein L29 [Chloroflexi bacterium]|nr:50S ribosomal protein L29 [Chloroflexota bacterium]